MSVEQVCNIFYILHRILYFLPEVRGEGTCGGGREERSINGLHDGHRFIYICILRTDHAVSCAWTMFGHACQLKADY